MVYHLIYAHCSKIHKIRNHIIVSTNTHIFFKHFPSFFINSQDYHDDIRQEQMWEMQALSTTQNQNLDPNNSDSSSPENGIDTDSTSIIDCLGSVLGTNGRCESETNLNTNSLSNGGGSGNSDTNVNTTMQMDVGQTNLLGSNNNLIPSTTGVTAAAITGLTSCNTVVALPNETDTETVFVDAASGILHPALRGIKAVNIGSFLMFY